MGVRVDAERYREAIEQLDSMVTGETVHDEGEMLIGVALDVPKLQPWIDRMQEPARPASLEAWARRTPLATHALDVASMSVNAGYDALVTIANLMLRGGSITQFGVLALSRQAAENAVLAQWCLASTDPGVLVTRGLAAAWKDMEDAGTFAASIGEPDLIEQNGRYRSRLLTQGRAQGLIDRKKGKSRPFETVPFWTTLFRETPTERGNLEWYYRALSGATHGRPWAQLGMAHQRQILEHVTQDSTGRIVPTGVVLVNSTPNVPLLGGAAFIAFDLLQRAVSAYNAIGEAPEPPVSRWNPASTASDRAGDE